MSEIDGMLRQLSQSARKKDWLSLMPSSRIEPVIELLSFSPEFLAACWEFPIAFAPRPDPSSDGIKHNKNHRGQQKKERNVLGSPRDATHDEGTIDCCETYCKNAVYVLGPYHQLPRCVIPQ